MKYDRLEDAPGSEEMLTCPLDIHSPKFKKFDRWKSPTLYFSLLTHTTSFLSFSLSLALNLTDSLSHKAFNSLESCNGELSVKIWLRNQIRLQG